METIHTLDTVKSFARSYGLLASFLLLATFLLLFVRLNAESVHYGAYYGDEDHTVKQALNLLVNGHVDNFRAQEGTRWLVRAFYPYALIYMNTHIGGNVYRDGWSYPGHNYVVEHFVNSGAPSDVSSADPNLREFFHALRQPYIGFVFACLLLLLLFFFKEKYYLVAFGGLLLLGFNLDFLAEQKLFYIEPAMLASLALLILTYCHCLYHRTASSKITVLFSFLAAFMISTKFSTVLFILLPIILFFNVLQGRDALRQVAIYMISLVAFYALVNFPAFISLSSFNLFLHDLSSNFWHYSAGSDSSITVAPGISHLGLIVHQLETLLGYALYILPTLVLFAIYHASVRERMVLIPLIVLGFLSIHSLSEQHVYLHRNLVPFYLPIAIVSLLSVEIVARRLAALYDRTYILGGLTALALLWCIGVIVHAGGTTSFMSALLPNSKGNFTTELQSLHDRSRPTDVWYAVSFPRHFFENEPFENRIVSKDGVPAILNEKNYPALIAQFDSLPEGSAVLVNKTGNNKHLTNYILPTHFTENRQFGNYYLFFDIK